MHSSAADSPISNILNRLTSDGDLDKGISVRLLLKNWSGAFTEWPTKAVRDAVYASPQFPRILKGTEAVQDTIAKGVSSGEIAYVSKTGDGKYSPFIYGTGLQPSEVEDFGRRFHHPEGRPPRPTWNRSARTICRRQPAKPESHRHLPSLLTKKRQSRSNGILALPN